MLTNFWAPNLLLAQFALDPEVLETAQSRMAISRLTLEQVEESFSKLEELSSLMEAWLHSAYDCTDMLLSGELDICTTWHHAVFHAQQKEGGESLHSCYECGHINQTDVFAIPRDAPNKPLAELFIAWTGHPHINSRISSYLPYGPINFDALSLLQPGPSSEVMSTLPTSAHALEKAVLLDERWLASVEDDLQEKFEEFLADVNP